MAFVMTDASYHSAAGEPIESVLREELDHGDAMIGTIIPIMRHLLASDDHSVFSEEIVARTRAMLEDISSQLLVARGEALQAEDARNLDAAEVQAMVIALCGDAALLAHVHGLAVEWQLTERLHARLGLDPVLSPLLQLLIASAEPTVAAAGMSLLASQTRFTQAQRRMKLALSELPAEILHAAIIALREHAGQADEGAILAEKLLCDGYDEGRSRLGLMARLIMGMGGNAQSALSIEHAGVGMFITALSIATGQDRTLATLTTNEGQVARLALALSSAGMKPSSVEQQFVAIHPEISLPEGFDGLGADRAAAILSVGTGYPR